MCEWVNKCVRERTTSLSFQGSLSCRRIWHISSKYFVYNDIRLKPWHAAIKTVLYLLYVWFISLFVYILIYNVKIESKYRSFFLFLIMNIFVMGVLILFDSSRLVYLSLKRYMGLAGLNSGGNQYFFSPLTPTKIIFS